AYRLSLFIIPSATSTIYYTPSLHHALPMFAGNLRIPTDRRHPSGLARRKSAWCGERWFAQTGLFWVLDCDRIVQSNDAFFRNYCSLEHTSALQSREKLVCRLQHE